MRVVLRALALLRLSAGQTDAQAAAPVGLTTKAVRGIGRRYEQGGLEGALYEKAPPGARPVLDAGLRQPIIAMVCSDPPQGYARWTVRLMAQEACKELNIS